MPWNIIFKFFQTKSYYEGFNPTNSLLDNFLQTANSNGGVDTSEFKYTKDKLPKGTLQKLSEIKKNIINGKIKINTIIKP